MELTRDISSRTALVLLAGGVLVLAGCGGAGQAVTKTVTAAAVPPGVRLYHPPHVEPATYNVSLLSIAGVPPKVPAGEPNASGLALMSINPSSNELCWQFSQLKNVTAPTAARFYVYTREGTYRDGLRLGSTFTPSGCVPLRPITLELIERKPQLYVVSINSARYPAGAVRGAL